MPEPTPLTVPTEFIEQKGKVHVPGDPDPDTSLPDSSPKKYNSSNDSSSIESKKKIQEMIFQTHHQAIILIRPTIVIIDSNGVREKATRKRIRSNYAHV